jgi:hypothetical protein
MGAHRRTKGQVLVISMLAHPEATVSVVGGAPEEGTVGRAEKGGMGEGVAGRVERE